MSDRDEQMKRMDEAASQAKEELIINISKWAAKDVFSWWSKSYMKAGHKRLGRVLVELSKKDGEGKRVEKECYCKKHWLEIVKDIDEGVVPEDALTKKCCWSAICSVAGSTLRNLCDHSWSELCSKRGNLRVKSWTLNSRS